jgi:hypothetical protein
MQEPNDTDEPDPLVVTEQTIEYKVRGYERFIVRQIRKRKLQSWFILDYDPEGNHGKVWASRVTDRIVIDMTPIELTPPMARITPVENREDAVELIMGLVSETVTYEMIETDDDLDVDNDWDDEDPEADAEDLLLLDEDEEEHPDYPDGHVSDEEEVAYAAEQAKREEWVEAA